MKILVTGAGGFIGSAIVRQYVQKNQHKIRALVRNTCVKKTEHRLNAKSISYLSNVEIINSDLLGDISGICEHCDIVIHAAAKTFVDHSILDPMRFVETNIVGTARLLEDARRYKVKRFIYVSTDEVYGPIINGSFDENSKLNPGNPYAASKAAAEQLVLAYANTYGLHSIITRTENNYGPYQHAQKVLPTFIKYARLNEPLPLYGDGQHVRQWLWVDDHANAIILLAEHKDIKSGEIFNVAGGQELTNLALAEKILGILDKPKSLIKFIDDKEIRPGHDRRYAISSDKIRKLGWKPQINLHVGIHQAVDWYRMNEWWLD